MRVRVLGSGDAFGTGGRLQTCLHLSGAGDILLDCGASSLAAMKRDGVDPSLVGHVLLTHLHGDHFGGVPFLVLDGQFNRRTLPLVVAGPPGVRARVESAMEVLFPGSSTVTRRFAIEYVELRPDEPLTLGPARVWAFGVSHPSGAPAYALRVQYAGRIVAYSGDTEWTDALLEAARDADLFVCEAYSFDRPIPHHLGYARLLAERDRLGCRRLLLTHLGPTMLARLSEVEVDVARDGLIVDLAD